MCQDGYVDAHDEYSSATASELRIVGRSEVHVRIGHPTPVRHRLMLDRYHARAGGWRTQSASNARTVCGLSLDGRYYAPVDDGYDGILCDRCFWPSEIETARQWVAEDKRKSERDADDAAAKFEAESKESLRQLELRTKERQDAAMGRFVTGKTAPIKKPEPDEEK